MSSGRILVSGLMLILVVALVGPAKSISAVVSSYDYVVGELVEPLHNGTSITDQDVQCKDMAIAEDGSAYILGTTDPYVGGGYAPDVVLTKWNSNAELVWTKVWDNGFGAEGFALATSGDFVYVAGRYFDESSARMLLMKWGADGSLVWTHYGFDDEKGYLLSDVAVAPDGSVFVVGAGDFHDPGLDTAYLLRYSSSGSMLWYRELGDVSLRMGLVTVTGTSEVYTYFQREVVKWTPSGDRVHNFTTTCIFVDGSPTGALYTATTGSNADPFILARWNSTSAQDWSRTMHVDWHNSMYPLHMVGALDAVPDDATYILFSLIEVWPDLVLARYDPSGLQAWNRSISYPFPQLGIKQMEVSSTGVVYVAGTNYNQEEEDSVMGLGLSIYKVEDLTPIPITIPPPGDRQIPVLAIGIAGIGVVAVVGAYIVIGKRRHSTS
ncbi:MAG: hypothetical protein ACE5H4_15170 [Candidatus Thorarchaeota archaeon]